MKTKAFVCLHGFGNHPGGRRPGFSAALRRSVESRLGAPVQAVAGLPEVKGDRLPDDVSALSLRSPEDWFAEPLGEAFPDVSEREVLPPPGTRGGANHKFYWADPVVAESVAAAAVAACSHAGEPPATAAELELLSRAAEDSLWSAGQYELDENGDVVGGSLS